MENNMADQYDVSIKVISQKGVCHAEHKVGDEWVMRGHPKTPGGICLGAFDSLHAEAKLLMFGGVFPWEPDPDAITVACPDGDNPVIFEVRRLREK